MAYERPLAFVNSYVPARLLEKVPRDRLLKLPQPGSSRTGWADKIAGLKLVASAKLCGPPGFGAPGILTGSPVLLVERNYLATKKKLVSGTAGFDRSVICLVMRSS